MFLKARLFGGFTRRASSKALIGKYNPKFPIHKIGIGATHFYIENENDRKPIDDYVIYSLLDVNAIKELNKHHRNPAWECVKYSLEEEKIEKDVSFFYHAGSSNGLIWYLTKLKERNLPSWFLIGFNCIMRLRIDGSDDNTLISHVFLAFPKLKIVTDLFFELLENGPKDDFQKWDKLCSIICSLDLKVSQKISISMFTDLTDPRILKRAVSFFEKRGESFDIHMHNDLLLLCAIESERDDIANYLIDKSKEKGYTRFSSASLSFISNIWTRDLKKLEEFQRRF